MFGGAFDPPHNAHVALVQAAMAQLQLDELRVVPTGHAWHKARVLTPARHRLAMTRLAFAGLPGVVVDDREMHRSGPSYTLDTLREFAAEQPGARLYLVMGEDQADALPSWHGWQDILPIATISIAEREHPTRDDAGFDPAKFPQGRFETLRWPPMPVSATQIRALTAKPHNTAQEIAELVPGPVARYIEHHHLYLAT
ncbi:MAG: nicotinate (nicotinamide) nucleotide adenylyltransferase [Rhodoferax sp.]|nr:nicotinate (nicotinamide) nucleotide adenylyltransferase [Rhodoferax sp.]